MHGGGSIYLSSHSRLTMPCCQSLLNERSSRSAGDATDGEVDPTCRVSSSGNDITQQAARAYRPLRNRSRAPRRRDATPSKRYCQLGCSECSNCHPIARNSRKKYRSQGASKSTSHPKAMACRRRHAELYGEREMCGYDRADGFGHKARPPAQQLCRCQRQAAPCMFCAVSSEKKSNSEPVTSPFFTPNP